MPRKLYLETFGCQMNVLDSELVLGQLRAQGYESTEDRDAADVILYNTCSVREHAEQKVWSRLGELRERKKADPGLVIGVIGCMAERDGKGIFEKYPHVDILCGPGELDKLPSLVHNAAITNGAEDGHPRPRLRFVTSFPRDFTGEALQAMRDCERICRYLHVPAQHGSDRVLRLMNRGYTVRQYRDFIARARATMPDVSIASDFIVG